MPDRDEMSDRELLIRLDEKMDTVVGRMNDHGRRLRSIEQWRWLMVGALVAIAAGTRIGSAAIAVLKP